MLQRYYPEMLGAEGLKTKNSLANPNPASMDHKYQNLEQQSTLVIIYYNSFKTLEAMCQG